jgi:trans-aconitate 2-methyltransferase
MKNMQNWRGDDYQKHSTPQFRAAQELLSIISFAGNEHILDIGCGSGAITASIAQKVPQGLVYAIDASEDMIKTAQNNYKSLTNLTFLQSNAENFIAQQKFDLVTSFSCLHWIKDKQKALDCIDKNLKEHGTFLAVLSLKQPKSPLTKAFVTTALSEKWRKHIQINSMTPESVVLLLHQHFYPEDVENFRSLLTKSGLEPSKLIPIERKITFLDKKDFIGWLAAWTSGLSFIASMPSEARMNFTTDIVEQYIAYVPLVNGSIEYTEHILVVHAQKK